ncbi:MAG TPA: fructosamine kinase family protein [Acidobacteriota bacterium]|nr:fructosamine kinase family protein [Acidobacteriota bacterium]
MSLENAVEDAIAQATGKRSAIRESAGVGGGCINAARRIELEDGREFFLKSNADPLPGMFEREAEGLEALAEAAGELRVPEVIAVGGGRRGAAHFIVMEHIPTGHPAGDFFRRLGRGFALLHQESGAERFGFEHDNYIGSTPQPNGWMEDWVDFYRRRRLGFQLELACQKGHADDQMMQLGRRLLDRLDEYIAQPDEPPCLLHGDLWSGNYLCDDRGRPVLIDPAVYYGRGEADLAMTRLFGGFDSEFYAAYHEVRPRRDGHQARSDLYQLYHLLNHLNLFGRSYLSGCLRILRRYA